MILNCYFCFETLCVLPFVNIIIDLLILTHCLPVTPVNVSVFIRDSVCIYITCQFDDPIFCVFIQNTDQCVQQFK